MLFTRCPECETTFRITAEALRKADGQVRCGRCACVFNGYNELRRRARRRAGPAPESASPAADTESAPPTLVPVAEAGLAQPTAKPPAPPEQTDAGPSAPPSVAASPETTDDEKDASVGDFSFAGVIAELEASAAPETDALGADLPAIDPPAKETPAPAADTTAGAKTHASTSDAKTDAAAPGAKTNASTPGAKTDAATAVAKTHAATPGAKTHAAAPGAKTDAATPGAKTGAGIADAPAVPASPSWVILDEARPPRVTPRAWTIGCAAALALLALQVVHHYRADLAVLGVVGPLVQHAYAALGTEIAPNWNIEQYGVEVDWDAVAQPSADGQGNLRIAARIRNEGPRALPLPHVQVQLKDRWESTIGSRVFAPSEYLPRGRAVDYVMKGGQSALAELDILDPGPQAYGFELDVCVATQNGALRCAADEVFR